MKESSPQYTQSNFLHSSIPDLNFHAIHNIIHYQLFIINSRPCLPFSVELLPISFFLPNFVGDKKTWSFPVTFLLQKHFLIKEKTLC